MSCFLLRCLFTFLVGVIALFGHRGIDPLILSVWILSDELSIALIRLKVSKITSILPSKSRNLQLSVAILFVTRLPNKNLFLCVKLSTRVLDSSKGRRTRFLQPGYALTEQPSLLGIPELLADCVCELCEVHEVFVSHGDGLVE